MKFNIRNRKEISYYYGKEKYILISITCIGEKHPDLPKDENMIDYLQLNFYDTDDDYPGNFTVKQARQILDFVKKYDKQVNMIMCQCDAGISRSSAVAAALSKIYNGFDDHIFNCKYFLPNRLVYKTLLNLYYEEYNDRNIN